MRPSACPTCGCTCAGAGGGSVSLGQADKYVPGREGAKLAREIIGKHSSILDLDSEKESQVIFTKVKPKTYSSEDVSLLQKLPQSTTPLIKSPSQQSGRIPLRSNLQSLPQSFYPTDADGDEFLSMKSLLANTTPGPHNFTFPPPMTPPPIPYQTPPPTHHPTAPPLHSPTPPLLTHYTTPPPSNQPTPATASTTLHALVHSLSSNGVSVDAKKNCLLNLTSRYLTEADVHQLLSVDTGDLLTGVKCVLEQFKDNNTNFRREVLVLAFKFFNQCMAFTKSSARLRSLVWNKSREVSRSMGVGEVPFIQSLVTMSDPVQGEGRLPSQMCAEVSSELRSLPLGVTIGKCSYSLETAEQVGKWVRLCLGTNREEVASLKMVQEMFKVMDLSIVQNGQEIRLDKLLVEKYPDQVWSVRHPVKEEAGADWTTITVVRLLPSGHVLAYTDMEWEERLARLEQELLEGTKLNLPVSQVRPGGVACVRWADVHLGSEELPPLVRCQLARVIVLSITHQGKVEVFLLDHGCRGTTNTSSLSPLPQHLATLTPCIVLTRLQGVLPKPDTSLLSPCLQVLSHLSNSRTVTSLVTRPSLSTPRIISQLISSPDLSLSIPAMSVMYTVASTEESRKHLLLSPVCLQLVVPSLIFLLSLPALQPCQLPTTLETLLMLLSHLPPDLVIPFYSDGTLVDSLTKVQTKLGESQYTDLVDRLFCLGGSKEKASPVQRSSSSAVKVESQIALNNNFQDVNSGGRGASLLSLVEGSKVAGGGGQVDMWMAEQDRIRGEEGERLKEESMRIYNEQLAQARVEPTKATTSPFIPLQVQTRAIRSAVSPPSSSVAAATEITSPTQSADTASAYVSASSSVRVTPVKSDPVSSALPSWLGVSNDAEDSSDSDSDSLISNHKQNSLPSWLGPQSGQEKSEITNENLYNSNSNSSASNSPTNPSSLPPWLAPKTCTAEEDMDSPDKRESSCSPGGVGCSGTESGMEGTRQGGLATEGNFEENVKESPWPNMSQVQEVVKLGQVLSEQQGVGVEFWEVERVTMLCPTTLAVLLCGILNSGGGLVFAGVGREGVVKGVKMGRGERDKTRQMLDRVCSTNINPRVGPRVVDIDFVKVDGGEELWLVKYTIRVQEEVLYRARNLNNRGFTEGVYVRNESGPNYTEFVSEEMLESVQGLGD